MAESALHRSMKDVVRAELERDEYAVIEEPLFPPGRRLSWSRYRPDLLCYRRRGGAEELVFVECETRPNMKRFLSKNFMSVSFQSYLFSNSTVRRILAVPRGKLDSVDMVLRSEWEVWVLGHKGPIQKAERTLARQARPGNEIT
ncbi:MAG: hypothetical protein HY247_05210 [archaeon]|nr:MAG: hypothetical protein HY247_05210 [archaeon]